MTQNAYFVCRKISENQKGETQWELIEIFKDDLSAKLFIQNPPAKYQNEILTIID